MLSDERWDVSDAREPVCKISFVFMRKPNPSGLA